MTKQVYIGLCLCHAVLALLMEFLVQMLVRPLLRHSECKSVGVRRCCRCCCCFCHQDVHADCCAKVPGLAFMLLETKHLRTYRSLRVWSARGLQPHNCRTCRLLSHSRSQGSIHLSISSLLGLLGPSFVLSAMGLPLARAAHGSP